MSEEIARELRPARAALADAMKNCGKYVSVVENAYGVERQARKPSVLEERKAREAMPGPLEAACGGLLGKLPLPTPKNEHERTRSFKDAFDIQHFRSRDR